MRPAGAWDQTQAAITSRRNALSNQGLKGERGLFHAVTTTRSATEDSAGAINRALTAFADTTG